MLLYISKWKYTRRILPVLPKGQIRLASRTSPLTLFDLPKIRRTGPWNISNSSTTPTYSRGKQGGEVMKFYCLEFLYLLMCIKFIRYPMTSTLNRRGQRTKVLGLALLGSFTHLRKPKHF